MTMKKPNANHAIEIAPAAHRVRITFAGHVVADSRRAIALEETSYPVVHYIPRDDVDMNVLRRTQHTTICPHKGQAVYYSIDADGRMAENAIWSYETPHVAVGEIAGYMAFYPQRVDTIELLPLSH